MKRKPVDSDMASSVGYDSKIHTLEIEFRPSGQVWQYLKIPKKIYQEMMSSGSIGQYFNQNIRGKYEEVQVV
jgi:hypothetical protein